MDFSRRSFFGAAGLAGAGVVTSTGAASASGLLSSRELGVAPDARQDQSRALQSAVDQASLRGGYLFLEPGIYVISGLKITRPLNIVGVPGFTRLVQAGTEPILRVENVSNVRLEGLTFDGQMRPQQSALVEAQTVRDLAIVNCLITNSSANGINLNTCSGEISGTTMDTCTSTAIFSMGGRGLRISGNLVTGMGDNGILVWQPSKLSDGSIVTENRIEKIESRSGGEGQNGNGINVYRGGNVIASNNQISDCAFTAVRNNSGSNIQITGNTCNRLGEVAIYSEFAVEGSLVANNLIDDAATGISITNFNEGGRLAVCQGNLVRNLRLRDHPVDKRGTGIGAEADATVVGNVVENAPTAGIWLGWGKYMRNVSATSNVLRDCAIGITASVASGAKDALIANNLIHGASRAAILGMVHETPATKDLASAKAPEQLTVTGNVTS